MVRKVEYYDIKKDEHISTMPVIRIRNRRQVSPKYRCLLSTHAAARWCGMLRFECRSLLARSNTPVRRFSLGIQFTTEKRSSSLSKHRCSSPRMEISSRKRDHLAVTTFSKSQLFQYVYRFLGLRVGNVAFF